MNAGKQENGLNYCSVPEFYKSQSIFVTGGTGFMGKVLLFKLLKSCPDIETIYLLMRPKRGHSVNERLCKLINGTVFGKLKNPLILGKIVPINGDISQPRLGISDCDQKLLIENVSVVFHLAATVKFDETLKDSVTINVLGTQRLIELCHDMFKLEAVVHVSTAYSNCDRRDITEMVYPPPFDPKKVIECVEWMDDEILSMLTPKLLGKHPNTYTFTKALAEHIIVTSRGKLPFVIVRPSVVLSSFCDPRPGWVDNWNGPNKIIACFGRGTFRSVRFYGEKTLDIIPVDMVVNLMICSAWHTAVMKPNCTLVYNCCTGQLNPITWQTFVDECIAAIHKYPSTNLVLKPRVTYYRNKFANYISDFFLHMVPAVLCDTFTSGFSRSPSFRFMMHRKFCEELKKLQYFALNEWQFYDYNNRLLYSMLDSKDRMTFAFDVTLIDWMKYIDDYILGIRTFVLKESLTTVPEGLRRQRKMHLMERVFKFVVTFFIVVTSMMMWMQKKPHFRCSIFNTVFNFLIVTYKAYAKIFCRGSSVIFPEVKLT